MYSNRTCCRCDLTSGHHPFSHPPPISNRTGEVRKNANLSRTMAQALMLATVHEIDRRYETYAAVCWRSMPAVNVAAWARACARSYSF